MCLFRSLYHIMNRISSHRCISVYQRSLHHVYMTITPAPLSIPHFVSHHPRCVMVSLSLTHTFSLSPFKRCFKIGFSSFKSTTWCNCSLNQLSYSPSLRHNFPIVGFTFLSDCISTPLRSILGILFLDYCICHNNFTVFTNKVFVVSTL